METGPPLPPGQHPYDPVKKDLDPIGFALYRVQTFLVWIDEHRAAFERARDTDEELAEAELSNLRDSTSQAMVHLQRLSELLLAGYTIDPGKKPAHIDLTIGDGPEKGKTLPGLYKLEKGELTLVFAEGETRPKGFTSEGDAMLLKLKKDAK